MLILSVSLEQFNPQQQSHLCSGPDNPSRYAVFHSFFFDDIKQYSDTTSAHIKWIIKLLNEK